LLRRSSCPTGRGLWPKSQQFSWLRILAARRPSRDHVTSTTTLEKKSVHVSDTGKEENWQDLKVLGRIASCIVVPLIANEMLQALLVLGSISPGTFTKEHFRLAKLLGIPFAVSVHRARLYEWAEIYEYERKELLRKADAAREH
jgi:GAF domain-containing protein